MMSEGVILDVDGVLVDVENSYRRAIHETISRLYGTALPDGTVQALKNAGRFNNDWELTDAAALYVLATRADLELSIEAFADRTESRGGGLEGARDVIEMCCEDPDKIEAAWSPARIREVFQALYLGSDLYRALEGDNPPIETEGYVHEEPVLIEPKTIQTIQAEFAVGVFTGRPAAEADIALERIGFSIPPQHRITMDDDVPGKPDPAGLLVLADRLDVGSIAFVGDTLDDVRTAVAANNRDDKIYSGIGVLTGGLCGEEGRRRFRKAGAEAVVPTVNDIPEYLLQGS